MKLSTCLLVLGSVILLAGCADPFTFGPRECYEIPKIHWDKCPFPRTRDVVKLPKIGHDGTKF